MERDGQKCGVSKTPTQKKKTRERVVSHQKKVKKGSKECRRDAAVGAAGEGGLPGHTELYNAASIAIHVWGKHKTLCWGCGLLAATHKPIKEGSRGKKKKDPQTRSRGQYEGKKSRPNFRQEGKKRKLVKIRKKMAGSVKKGRTMEGRCS